MLAAAINAANNAGLPIELVMGQIFAGLTTGLAQLLGPDQCADMLEEAASVIRAHDPPSAGVMVPPPPQLPN